MLKVFKSTSVFLLLAVFAVSTTEVIAQDAACFVTQQRLANHIKARHCPPDSEASEFLPVYCIDAAHATAFCQMVQQQHGVTRTVQPDGRIRYDSQDLGQVVGSAGERCGRVIISAADDGDVVTQFPQQC